QARGGEPVLNDRLNKIDQTIVDNHDDVTQQLAETATKEELQDVESSKMDKDTTDISFDQINKNKRKLDETFMTDDFLQQMAGNTPIHSVPAEGSLTTEYFAKKSVTPEK